MSNKIKTILNGVYIGLLLTWIIVAVECFLKGKIICGMIAVICALIKIGNIFMLNRKPKVQVIELSEKESKELLKKLFDLEKDQENNDDK